ncbi:BNR-4 repeat-containing protein [Alteromonas sp. M12]|uniref:BNR-4 repeat-containing protein n=1 Tax=Alteromonas sp. M12 TaxID=3135644 RepID=UPI00319E2C2D
MKFANQLFGYGFYKSTIPVLAPLLVSLSLVCAGCVSNHTLKEDTAKHDFLEKRKMLIEKYSEKDNVFSTLHGQIDSNDLESSDYWRWRIDQYMYGQYPEYQVIYDSFRQGRTFNQIYGLSSENLGPKTPLPDNMPALPHGYFTENLPGNPHRGWHTVVGDTVYITYQGHLTDPYIASYNLNTHQWHGPNRAAKSTLSKGDRKIDSHGRPIIELDSNGHLHIVYGGHGGEREDGLNPLSIDTPHAGGRMLHVMSEKPYDISSFVYVNDISPFASYTKSYKMGNGDIYLFTRAGTHKSPWVYYKMKNGQQHFEDPVIITWPTPQQDTPINVDTFYINPVAISDTEIAISFLWHECNFNEVHNKTNYGRVNAYFMKLDTESGNFYNAQNEVLSLPITLKQANAKTLAFDSTRREETPFNTKPIILKGGTPAVAYEALTDDFREWRMTAFKNGKWIHSLPIPETVNRTLRDSNDVEIVNLEILDNSNESPMALVVYKDSNGKTIFAEAESDNGRDWHVTKKHLKLENVRIQMEAVKNRLGDTVAVVLNLKKGASQRLYLWHEGTFRTPLID